MDKNETCFFFLSPHRAGEQQNGHVIGRFFPWKRIFIGCGSAYPLLGRARSQGNCWAATVSTVACIEWELRAVVPKLVRTVTQIKVVIMSYHPQKIFSLFRSKTSIAVITHNTDQHCDFVSALPTEESHITPGGNLPQFGNHLLGARGPR